MLTLSLQTKNFSARSSLWLMQMIGAHQTQWPIGSVPLETVSGWSLCTCHSAHTQRAERTAVLPSSLLVDSPYRFKSRAIKTASWPAVKWRSHENGAGEGSVRAATKESWLGSSWRHWRWETMGVPPKELTHTGSQGWRRLGGGDSEKPLEIISGTLRTKVKCYKFI